MGAVVDGIVERLRGAGLVGAGAVELQPLTGGVSCDVWKVDALSGPIVVKRPLERLRVAADWHAPVERDAGEVRWLRRARGVDARIAPEVLAEFPDMHAFALRFVDGCPVWKDELIALRIDAGFAAAVGIRIASVHAATAHSAADQVGFPTDAIFRALRIDPFIAYVADRNDAVAEPLRAIAADLGARKTALVHGDVSPKNILISADGPVFLDAECAVYGDPAFDLAFCVTHLLLKALWLDNAAVQQAAVAMVRAYCDAVCWEQADDLAARAGRLAAALLLARVDGKSPASYLVDAGQKTAVRMQAQELLLRPQPIDTLVTHWKRTPA